MTLTVPTQAGTTRTQTHILGVDSGTMMIAPTERFRDLDDIMDTPGFGDIFRGKILDGAALSQSGYGDGGYPLCTVHSPDGAIVGYEVTFLFPDADKAADALVLETYPNGSPDYKTDPEGSSAYWRVYNDLFNAQWDALHPTTDPADRLTPKPLGTVTVTERGISAGDPCYGGPTATVDAPVGEYVAVVWHTAPDNGEVARLGLYRTA